MDRDRHVARLDDACDVLVIGGGATGTGAALDAVTRGYTTTLVEAADFASATSSRSTKLVHGGVRYLQQGNVALVREALFERARLFANAPHLVDALAFCLPVYTQRELPYFAAGLAAYDLLAGAANFERSRPLGKRGTLARIPGLRGDGLAGCVRYFDAQFDDARLALAIARTAADRGAAIVNYARAERLTHTRGRVDGAVVRDEETGREHHVRARTVVNATGIFVDALRRADEPAARPLLTHSRGSHLVFGREILGGSDALIVPRTSDGRVLFAIPWYGHVVVGTTDVETGGAELRPAPTRDEMNYIVETLNGYLARPVRVADAVAAFAGLRPLVSAAGASTAQLSREHVVETSPHGLVSVTGGKWTTYRKMAEDTIDVAARAGRLLPAPSRTAHLTLHGGAGAAHPQLAGSEPDVDAVYGTDAPALRAIEAAEPDLAERLDPRLPYRGSHVAYAARYEMARTVDDVISRRTRALFLNDDAARASMVRVGQILARELGRDVEFAYRITRDPGERAVPATYP